jgi:hypothetical protein
VFLALALKPRQPRLQHLAIVIAPLLVIFLVHSWHRWGWMAIVRTSGAVLHPSLESLSWLLPLTAALGIYLALAAGDRRPRVTLVLLLVIVIQAITLFAIAKAQGATTPYMAFKMVYLAIYPLAIFGAYGMTLTRGSTSTVAHEALGWVLAGLIFFVAVPEALNAPRSIPVVNLDLYDAGQWLRANQGATCADYLVADAETAYWLHLAVLGNPRSGERMVELDRYEPRAAIAPWITSAGRHYAIADLRLLPDEVRSRVDIAALFGSAAVIKRRDATIKGCD